MNLFIKNIIAMTLSLSVNANTDLTLLKNGESLHTTNLQKLKDKFDVQKVTIFNPYTLKPETYNAFSMKQILSSSYTNKWINEFAIRVTTKDGYLPIIETYKFQERKAFLAFSRADNKKFVSLTMYKEKIVDLAPYYLIWIEDKEKFPSRRKAHWPYKVTGFDLISNVPEVIVPPKDADKKIKWGYENVRKHCLSCHSIYGYGSTKVGELITNNLTKKFSDKKLRQLIHNPRSIDKKNQMPRFSPKIDMRKSRIKNIVHYLRFLEKRGSRKRVKSTKTLIKTIEEKIN
ncbi:cytochrome c [Halobacteriovorax sp.]|uniref:c-type cytochrome n=1 Tax=Halobacteriovorax sp. TaxID=2020862 RepID=UPI00356619DD